MITGVNHIGIAVKSIEQSLLLYTSLLGNLEIHRETVAEQKVNVASFTLGNVMIELLEATSDESPIAQFIEKRGEGIHHIALSTNDITTQITETIDSGFEMINTEPRVGAHSALVAFLHPKSTGKVLIELCQPQH
jgi:methylmalonyl-CoA/ethylmalonyl-CoA epimerase